MTADDANARTATSGHSQEPTRPTMQVVFITALGDEWGWRLAATGEHGAVADVDGTCSTRDAAIAEAHQHHPGVKIVDVDNSQAAF